jgi:hypothetical protein
MKIEICKRLQAQGLLEPKGNGAQNNVAKKKANKIECNEYFKVKKQLNFLMFLSILPVYSTKRPDYSTLV